MNLFGKLTKKSRLSKINSEFTAQIGRIATQIAKGKRNEEETRRWCVDILRTGLGYKDHDIETEASALGQRIDIAIKHDDRIIMVIECKAATVELTEKAAVQAANYASSIGAEWIVITNGHTWILFHVSVTRGKEPDIEMVFAVEILDDDGLSTEDASNLYLLTKTALLSGETIQEHHNQRCMNMDILRRVFHDESVTKYCADKIKSEYAKETGVKVDVSAKDVSLFLMDLLNLVDDDQD